MAITTAKYDNFLLNQMNGGNGTAARVVDFDTDTIKVMLVTNAYVPNFTTHAVKSDITNEVTGTNYTAGGTTLSSKTVSLATGTVTFDAADVAWLQSASGFSTARYAIVYKDTGTASTSSLIEAINFGADNGNVNGDFSIQWLATGISTWA